MVDSRPTLLLVLTLVVAAGAAVAPATADGFVSVSATATPTDPVAEEPFTVEATVSNAADSDTGYRIRGIEVREGSSSDSELLEERDVSETVDPGVSSTVDVETQLNESGTQTVYLHISVWDGTTERSVVQPVTVQVRPQHPQLEVTTDAEPAGNEQTMTVSVSNGLDEQIRNVELTAESDTVALQNSRRVAATVASGADRSFEFRATPEAEAVQNVTVSLRYTAGDDRSEVSRTLLANFSVDDADREHPQVEVRAESGAAGEPRTTTLTLSNGLEASVRNVELAVDGERVTFNDNRRVAAALAAGESRSFEFSATPADPTTLPVDVALEYTVNGERQSITEELQTDFSIDDEPAQRPQLELSVPDAIPGSTRPVNVTVANGLDQEVRQLSVRVASEEVRFGATERVRSQLGAGGTATFRFPATVEAAGVSPVNVTMIYTDDGGRQRVTRTFRPEFGAPSNPGTIALTGVETTARGGSLEISATASNVGSGTVEGVVVSVDGADAVDSRDYFVGEVEGSDFSSFTLTAGVTGNVSSVPVQVRYVVDGVERTYTTDLSVEQVAVDRPDRSGGGGLPVVPIVGLLVVVVIVAVYRWRG